MAQDTWITVPPSMAPPRSEGAPSTPHPMSQPTGRRWLPVSWDH